MWVFVLMIQLVLKHYVDVLLNVAQDCQPIWKQYLVKLLPLFPVKKKKKKEKKAETALGVLGYILFTDTNVLCFQLVFVRRKLSDDHLLLFLGYDALFWATETCQKPAHPSLTL